MEPLSTAAEDRRSAPRVPLSQPTGAVDVERVGVGAAAAEENAATVVTTTVVVPRGQVHSLQRLH